MVPLTASVGLGDHIQGAETAIVTLVQYGDYQCPSCGSAYPIIKEVQKHFGSQLRFIFRHFPSSDIHPYAEAAAEVAEFASAHGKFWEMHDRLFKNQICLSATLFSDLTKELKLSPVAMFKALEDGEFTARVRSDYNGGVRSGVNGTPTLFVNGYRHDDAPDFKTLSSVIQAALGGAQRDQESTEERVHAQDHEKHSPPEQKSV